MSMSRSVSRVVSPEPVMEEEDSDDSDAGELPFLYMPEPVGQPVLVPDQSYGQPTMSWGYEQPAPYAQEHFLQQGYQYPQQSVQMQSYEGQSASQRDTYSKADKQVILKTRSKCIKTK
jgi:hypothetical protein